MTDPAVKKAPAALAVDQAVILTSSGLFDGRSHHRIGDAGPLTRVGGITLFTRAVLALQRAGVREVLVLAGDEEQALRSSVQKDSRVTIHLRWMPVREFPPNDIRTWEALGAEIRGSCLVVGGRALFSRGLIETLRDQARSGELALVVRPAQDQSPVGKQVKGSGNLGIKFRGGRAIALYEQASGLIGGIGTIDGVAADLLVLPGRYLRAACKAGFSKSTSPLRVLLEQAVIEGVVQAIPITPSSSDWYHEVLDRAGVRSAERMLLHAHPGKYEGIVDRYFNRPVSRPFTRVFLRLGLSANAVTGISIFIGLLAAACFAIGNYAAGIAGALLFQLSAVVDCCDGEMARVTFSESEFGAKLDIIGDNVVHMCIFGGMALGLYYQQGAESVLPLALGAAAILGNACSLWIVSKAQRLHRDGAPQGQQRSGQLEFLIRNVASRDFSVVVVILALLGWLEGFLWLAAIGSNVFWVVMVWVTRRFALSRA